jgi:acyl carrier protein
MLEITRRQAEPSQTGVMILLYNLAFWCMQRSGLNAYARRNHQKLSDQYQRQRRCIVYDPALQMAALGLDSLDMVEMLFEIEDRCGFQLPDPTRYPKMSFRDMLADIEAAIREHNGGELPDLRLEADNNWPGTDYRHGGHQPAGETFPPVLPRRWPAIAPSAALRPTLPNGCPISCWPRRQASRSPCWTANMPAWTVPASLPWLPQPKPLRRPAWPAQPADARRIGVFVGIGFGGAHTLDGLYQRFQNAVNSDGKRNPVMVHPLSVPRMMANAAAAAISMHYGFKGPSNTYSVACASSAVAIGEAFRAIRDGYLDAAVVVGCEAMLTPAPCWPGMPCA